MENKKRIKAEVPLTKIIPKVNGEAKILLAASEFLQMFEDVTKAGFLVDGISGVFPEENSFKVIVIPVKQQTFFSDFFKGLTYFFKNIFKRKVSLEEQTRRTDELLDNLFSKNPKLHVESIDKVKLQRLINAQKKGLDKPRYNPDLK